MRPLGWRVVPVCGLQRRAVYGVRVAAGRSCQRHWLGRDDFGFGFVVDDGFAVD